MLKIGIFYYFIKDMNQVEFHCRDMFMDYFYYCLASPLLLTTVHKCLETEETSWERNAVQFLSVIGFYLQTVLDLLCCILRLKLCQIFSTGQRSGL